MAAPPYVGGYTSGYASDVASQSTPTTTISLTSLSGGLASAPAAGDMVIVATAQTTFYSETAPYVFDASDTEYTLIAAIAAASDSYPVPMRLYAKIMGATPDTSLKIGGSNRGGGDQPRAVAISVWRGASTSCLGAGKQVQTATGINSGLADPPSITPTNADSVVLAFGAGSSTTNHTFTSSDLTDFISSQYAGSYNRTIIGGGYKSWPGSGSVDPSAFGFSSGSDDTYSTWAAASFVIWPDPVETEGSLNQTLADTTLSATGSVLITGGVTTTLAGSTLDADGSVLIGGSLNAALDDTGIVAAGITPITGEAAITLDDTALIASGTVSGNSLNVTFEDTTLSAAGTVSVSGSGAITLDDAALDASGTVSVTGQAGIVLADTALSAAGDVRISGSLDAVTGDTTLDAAGTVTTPPFPSGAGISAEAYTTLLVEVSPLDPVDGTRKTIRATSVNDHRVTGLNDLIWRPAISENARVAIRLFKGDFDGTAAPAGGNLSLQIDQLLPQQANARRFIWVGASIKLWAGKAGDAWPWTQVFEGLVGDNPRAERNRITLPIEPNTEPFEADVLTLTYAGTGAAEGGADLTDKPKPWLLGVCLNAQPVLINTVDSVFQFSAYGPIEAVVKLYERGSDFGAAIGDYANYAALLAATIPPGRWATCLAEGMVRLGAPPAGVITGDVNGDKYGGTWRRKTGEIITRIATNAGASSHLDAASLAALDIAVAAVATTNQGRTGIYLTDQESLMDCAARMAAPCNAQAGISLMGKLFVSRIAIGSPSITLDAQQREMPRVTKSIELGTRPPFFRVEMGYARSWRVHTTDEIAYEADLIERGLYKADEFYREGNIVSLADGSRWVYTNSVPGSGNAPPTWPTTTNAYWDNLTPPLRFQVDARLKPERVRLPANADGSIISYAPATFAFVAKQSDGVDVSASFVLSIATGGNPDGLTYTLHNETNPPSIVVSGGFSGAEAPGELTVLATGGGEFSGVEFERMFTLEIDKTGVMLQQLMTANDQNGLTPADDITISNLTLKTTHPDGRVTYTADVAWAYNSDPANANNFDDLILILNPAPTSAPVTLGGLDAPGANERGGRLLIDVTSSPQTVEILTEADPTKWYTFGFQKFRKVNTNVAAKGYVVGPVEQYGTTWQPASAQAAGSSLNLVGTNGFADTLDGPVISSPIERIQIGGLPLKSTNPRSIQLKRTKFGVDVTAAATWSIDSYYNCAASITSGGLLGVTGSTLGQVVSGDKGNAYVRVKSTHEGYDQYYLVVFDTRLGEPVSVTGTSVNPVVVGNPQSINGFSLTSYTTISDVLTFSTGPLGYIRLCFVYNYSAPYGSQFKPHFKYQSKKSSSGTWLDGFEDTGASGVVYDAVYERKRARIFTVDLTGGSANTSYDFRVQVKRDSVYGAVSGDIEGLAFWGQGW